MNLRSALTAVPAPDANQMMALERWGGASNSLVSVKDLPAGVDCEEHRPTDNPFRSAENPSCRFGEQPEWPVSGHSASRGSPCTEAIPAFGLSALQKIKTCIAWTLLS